MNCRRFQDDLFEYVDGTLSADALAAAQKHVEECDACRQAVERERRLATALSSRLRQISQPLTLRPEVKRNILAAARTKGLAPSVAGSLIDLFKYWGRMAIPFAVLLIAGIPLAIHFFGTKNRESVSVPVTPRVTALASSATNQPTLVSVQMSYRLPKREFHREGNLVVDTFVDEAVVVDETIPSGSLKHLPQKLEFKPPL